MTIRSTRKENGGWEVIMWKIICIGYLELKEDTGLLIEIKQLVLKKDIQRDKWMDGWMNEWNEGCIDRNSEVKYLHVHIHIYAWKEIKNINIEDVCLDSKIEIAEYIRRKIIHTIGEESQIT